MDNKADGHMDRQTDLRQKIYKEVKAEIPYDLQKLKRTETEAETETITGFRDDESSLRYSSSKKRVIYLIGINI